MYNIIQIIDNEKGNPLNTKQINNDNIYIGALTLTKLTQKLANKNNCQTEVLFWSFQMRYKVLLLEGHQGHQEASIKKSVTNIHAKYYAHSTHKQLII